MRNEIRTPAHREESVYMGDDVFARKLSKSVESFIYDRGRGNSVINYRNRSVCGCFTSGKDAP